jgi:hypothetical protein
VLDGLRSHIEPRTLRRDLYDNDTNTSCIILHFGRFAVLGYYSCCLVYISGIVTALDGLRSQALLVSIPTSTKNPRLELLPKSIPTPRTYDLNDPLDRSLLPLRKHHDLVDLLNRFTFDSTSYLPLYLTSSTSNSTNPTYILGRLVILGNTDVPGRVTDRLQSV